MTRDEAVKILAETWGGCQDATGLLFALERIGIAKFDLPERDSLINEAGAWTRQGGCIAVSPDNMAAALRLIGQLASELKKSV